MVIKALIFDFDGLILDTETPEFHTWQEIYTQHGVQLELSEWLACVGTSQEAFDPVLHLQDLASQKIDPETVLTLLHKRANEKIESQPIMAGVIDYLQTAKKLGLKIGLSSSSTRKWVKGHLQRLGIIDYFDVICTSDDVEQVKPDPALYLCAITSLQVRPEEGIALEDSLNGLRSAKNAGLYCVVVPNFVTKELVFDGADMKLDNLEDKSLVEIISQLNGRT